MENKRPSVIKRSSDFLLIKESGQKKLLSAWLLLSYKKNSLDTWRFGTTASRKTGPAVIRNKLKRWVRSYFRAHFNDLSINEESALLINTELDTELKNNIDAVTINSDESKIVEVAVILNSQEFKKRFLNSYDLNFVFRPMPKDFYKNMSYQEFVKTLDHGLNSIEASEKRTSRKITK